MSTYMDYCFGAAPTFSGLNYFELVYDTIFAVVEGVAPARYPSLSTRFSAIPSFAPLVTRHTIPGTLLSSSSAPRPPPSSCICTLGRAGRRRISTRNIAVLSSHIFVILVVYCLMHVCALGRAACRRTCIPRERQSNFTRCT